MTTKTTKSVETKTAAKAAEKKVETKPATKADEKKVEVKPAAKATEKKAETKTVAKVTESKTVAKKTAKKENNIFVQFAGMEFNTATIEKAVKDDYKLQNGKKTMTSVSIYIKPEDGKAYYVIDGFAGSIAL